ncbi:MAG TPA: pantoate--beta-alanine ligase [Candidatus Polarisedimenticolia bacterium]|nr:pantoate--beta-alanine ligase [Candidatus Polarisedimenticolia bacterium]
MAFHRTARDMREASEAIRRQGLRLGLVPTMGALHEGHLSLVAQARADCDVVVASVYVNPLQFGPREDFAAYPRDLERDARLLGGAGTAILFSPAEGEVHVPDHRTSIEVTGMQDVLCGRSRPGHFRGVCTVVAKLFQIVAPHAAYFGEKDAQQLRIVRRMTRDLHFDMTIVGCPTVRAEDGLALSSRNAYLSPEERHAAPVLHRALQAAAARVRAGERDVVRLVEETRAVIAQEPLARIDYVEAVDDETLGPVEVLDRPVLLAVAVFFGRARLIDNIVIRPDSP